MQHLTLRHLLGGFLGGTLGSLSGGTLHPIGYPVGCFVGVVIGFWHREMLTSLVASQPEVARASRQAGAKIATATRKTGRRVLQIILAGLLFVTLPVWVPIWLLYRAIKWLAAHPVNRADTLRGVAIVIFCGVCILMLIHLIPTTEVGAAQTSGQWFASFLATFMLLIGTLTTPLITFGWNREHQTPVQRFYGRFARYARSGPIAFFLQDLGSLVWNQVLMMVGIGLIFVVMLILGNTLAAPVGLFLLTVLCIRFVSSSPPRHQHWLCFAVTLIVTLVSARVFGSGQSGATLWMLALSTGIVAGLASEGARRGFSVLLQRYPLVVAWAKRPIDSHFEWMRPRIQRVFIPSVDWIIWKGIATR